MNHTLVKPDGTLGPTHDFPGAPPTLAPNKGRWLPDNPPAYDPDTQKIKVSVPISAQAVQIQYQVQPLSAQQIAKRAALKDALTDLENMRATPFAKQFAAFNVNELNAHIDQTTTDLDGMRIYVKRLSRVLLPIIKRELLE